MVDGIDITSMSGKGADGPGPDEDLTRGETKPPVTVLVCEDEGLIRIYLARIIHGKLVFVA